jgi:hypothetical protein
MVGGTGVPVTGVRRQMGRFALLTLILAGAVLAPAALSDNGTDWQALDRPLHLPTLAAGHRCPVSRLAPESTEENRTIGAIGPGFALARRTVH